MYNNNKMNTHCRNVLIFSIVLMFVSLLFCLSDKLSGTVTAIIAVSGIVQCIVTAIVTALVNDYLNEHQSEEKKKQNTMHKSRSHVLGWLIGFMFYIAIVVIVHLATDGTFTGEVALTIPLILLFARISPKEKSANDYAIQYDTDKATGQQIKNIHDANVSLTGKDYDISNVGMTSTHYDCDLGQAALISETEKLKENIENLKRN